jgi:Outer membrane protein beta-barrel domain
MRRAVLGIAIVGASLLGAASTLRAQAGLGIKAGMSYGTVSNVGVLPGNLHSRSGFAAGLGLETGGPVGLGIEALYAQRGVSGGAPGDARALDYLDVPVYLRVGAPTPGISPFAYVGPQASFELQCRAGGTSCPSTGRPGATYAGVIGAGVRLMGGLTVEGRYVYGLSDLKLSTVTTSDSYRTRSFLLLVGVGF